MPEVKKNPLLMIAAVIAGVILIGLLFFFLFNRDTGQTARQTDEDETVSNEAAEFPVASIIRSPESFIGRTVAISGTVRNAYDSRTFTIAGEQDSTLLIITQGPLLKDEMEQAQERLKAGAKVKVGGEVQEFIVAEIEDRYNLDINQDIEKAFAGKPVMAAASITFTGDDAATFQYANP